ncbi:MAG: hypothetical protein HYT62_01590 [Candidatus Yanofskybacteria bacterium]|nr:hypothetical protein [Candidatus Yanofskybacteria bacterium]
MGNRPIIWGLIFFGIGTVGWVVSVVFNVVTLGAFAWISNVLGIIALLSLPIALICELIRRKKK